MYDQAERLRRQLSFNPSQAKTIAFASGKGGVGKSNTALNFALELQAHGKSALLFDLDSGMGNIDILLGTRSKYTIVDFFTNFNLFLDIIETDQKELSYILGGASLNNILQFSGNKLDYFFHKLDILVHTSV